MPPAGGGRAVARVGRRRETPPRRARAERHRELQVPHVAQRARRRAAAEHDHAPIRREDRPMRPASRGPAERRIWRGHERVPRPHDLARGVLIEALELPDAVVHQLGAGRIRGVVPAEHQHASVAARVENRGVLLQRRRSQCGAPAVLGAVLPHRRGMQREPLEVAAHFALERRTGAWRASSELDSVDAARAAGHEDASVGQSGERGFIALDGESGGERREPGLRVVGDCARGPVIVIAHQPAERQ